MGQSNQYSNNYKAARTEKVAVLLTNDEIELLRKHAARVGSSMAEVIRHSLGIIIMSKEDIEQMVDDWADRCKAKAPDGNTISGLIGDVYRKQLKFQLTDEINFQRIAK